MPKKGSDIDRLKRVQMIYSVLRHSSEESAMSSGALLDQLSSAGLSVNIRTLQRDIRDMSEGYKICATDTHPPRYYIAEGMSVDYQLSFNEAELQTIMLALENLKQTSPLAMQKSVKETQSVLASKLPKALKQELLSFGEKHQFSYGINGRAIARDNKGFEMAMRGLREERAFSCLYRSPYKSEGENERVRRFAPLIFQMAGGIPYLFVRDLDDQGLKNLRMTRVERVKLLDEEVRPLNSDLRKAIRENDRSFGGWGFGNPDLETKLYKFECGGNVAGYFLEREISPNQRVYRKGEKWVVEFELPESGEVERLLRGFGIN